MERAPDGFVLDGSVTMAWCFADESTAYTDGIRDMLIETRAVVPAIWPLEVSNAALVGERRGRLDPSRTLRFLNLLGGLRIIIDDRTSVQAFGATTHLARIHGLSSYDAAYLELAMRRALPLATLDAKLNAAARAVGVPLVAIP